MTRQKLGQHFLQGGWRGKIAATLPLVAGETWIEIGAGHGEMTQSLAGESRRVVTIETDPSLARRLDERRTENPSAWMGVTVVHGNVLALDLAALAGSGERFRIYGNLPYYITSPILRHLFRWAEQITSIHIVVQLEVAARIAAHPDRRDYGYLSVLCQFYTKPEIVLRIPPGAFRPPPRVASALLRMNLPGERATIAVADEANFLTFLQTCFAQKRKTLRNNLRALGGDERVRSALEACELRPDARAEQLSLRRFAALFENLR
ncbi:MAG: 16S rRNA (adenine(1518)-N(6)/adenine(1519)-N(6))-dimethyltransferase RsmA [Candidatus Acidiferrales bacterium]